VALAGCGGEQIDAGPVLAETAAKLGKIRSAESLHVRLFVDPRERDPFGFEIEGPFSCGDGGAVPTLDVEYTQTANGEEATVRLVADGTNGFVVLGENAYEMSDEQETELAAACADLTSDGGLASVDVGDWVVDPKASRDGDVDRVEGEVDVVAVTNGLVDVARSFGGSTLSQLDRDDAQKIAEATEDSEFELVTGHEDRLLRFLLLEAELGFDTPDDLRELLGEVGATFTFELEVDGPNEAVEVEPPADPRPASELP
jgi:hypothetical protein